MRGCRGVCFRKLKMLWEASSNEGAFYTSDFSLCARCSEGVFRDWGSYGEEICYQNNNMMKIRSVPIWSNYMLKIFCPFEHTLAKEIRH